MRDSSGNPLFSRCQNEKIKIETDSPTAVSSFRTRLRSCPKKIRKSTMEVKTEKEKMIAGDY